MSPKLRSITSSVMGNTLEWYEYTLYSYFATLVSKLFFPTDNNFHSILMMFTTFAVGIAARPVGGIIFGYIGDTYSRKKILTTTMLLMSVPTFCIAVLPTYESIGILAPIILTILRIVQGVALGGEFGGSCVYLFESAPEGKRGFFATLAITGVGLGLVLSSSTILVIETIFTKDEIVTYAWRIPFLVGSIGAILGFYMRISLLETVDFEKAKKENLLVLNPLKVMFADHRTTIILLFTIFLTTQASFFIIFIFGKSIMIEFLNFETKLACKFNILTVVSYTLSTFLFACLADKINKKYVIMCGIMGMLLASYPLIVALESENSSAILVMLLLFGALIGMSEGVLNPLVAESFPIEIRATSVSFCWNFTSVIFGATAPLITMLLIKNFGGIEVIAYYLITVCCISVIGMIQFMTKDSQERSKILTKRAN